MPTRINGIGTKFIGHKDQDTSGEFTTMEWFTIFYFPVVPLKTYRVAFGGSQGFVSYHKIIKKIPMDWRFAAYTYVVSLLTLVVSLAIVAATAYVYDTLLYEDVLLIAIVVGSIGFFLPLLITSRYLLSSRPTKPKNIAPALPK